MTEQDLARNRALVARLFLRGDGIEIGALHNPMPVPPPARVKYVDRMSAEGLRLQYPELKDLPLVDADIIDDGETLSTVPTESQDFIIASHFFEHCQNPVAALQSFVRVLRPDGILFLVIPDKLYTFDKERPSTSIQHIVRDFEEGPAWSKEQHYREYARLVDHAATGEAEELRAQYLIGLDYSIHFHVWNKPEVLELLASVNQKYRMGYEIRLFLDNGQEGIYVLQKSARFGEPVKISSSADSAAISATHSRGPEPAADGQTIRPRYFAERKSLWTWISQRGNRR